MLHVKNLFKYKKSKYRKKKTSHLSKTKFVDIFLKIFPQKGK